MTRALPNFQVFKTRLRQIWLASFTLVVLALVTVACQSQLQGKSADLVVGSKNFTEQLILGELLAQHIEATTDLKVDRRLNLGGTFICHQGLLSGQLDAYVEYSGTAYAAILKQDPISDPSEVYRRVKQLYRDRFQIEVTEPLGFENTFAMIIRGEDAERLNLKTLSQAAQHTPTWRAGFGYEFIERDDGFPGLARAYGIRFAKRPQVMDLGLMYRALVEKKVDMVAGNSTDGPIARLDLKVLEDDRGFFPPYEAIPLIRQAALAEHPELRESLQQLANILTADEMQNLNYQVEGEFRKIKQVAGDFLHKKGLISKSDPTAT